MFFVRKPLYLTLFCLLMIVLAGCTSNQIKTPSATTNKTVTSGTAAEQSAAVGAASGQTGQGTVPNTPKLIKTADITIEVGKGEFEKKFDDAKNVAARFGGHVTNSSATRTKGEMISGTVTIRVPSKEFDNAIAAIKKIGKVNSLSIKADDVSEEYVDLTSRLKNYQAQEAQLLTIMAKAQTVDETLKVQEQLTAVQGEIEVIKGRMQFLDNRVDFSTITLNIQEPSAVVPAADEWGFVDALRTAAQAFLWTINSIIVVVGALLPVVILVWLVVLAIRFLLRRRKAM